MKKGNVTIRLLTEYCVMGEVYENEGRKFVYNKINPFYKTTIKVILNNIEYAKECYKKVHRHFINAHFNRTGRLIEILPMLILGELNAQRKYNN